MAKVLIPEGFEPERTESFRVERLALDKIKKSFKNDNDVVIYFRPVIYIPRLGKEIAPDIIWFKEGVGAAIIEVKAWDFQFLKACTVERGRLKHIPSGQTFTFPVYEIRRFLEGILNIGVKPLGWVFFLPNLKYSEYEKLPEEIKNLIPYEKTIFAEDYYLTNSKEIIREKIFGSLAQFYNSIPQEEINKNLLKLKKLLFPYLEIPRSENLLDEVQEQLLYNLKSGHRIIRGGPGSGKTITLLGKALHEALKVFIGGQRKKIVFLTYTTALVNKIRKDLEEIIQKRELPTSLLELIEVKTFHSYAKDVIREMFPSVQVDYTKAIEQLLSLLKDGDIDERFKADVLLVDEAQDIRLDWFPFFHKLKKENTAIAFGVDETQRIYEGTNWKWKDTGFKAQGRVTVLRKIYRSSGKILDLAIEFLKLDKVLFKNLKELEGTTWLDEMENLIPSGEGKIELKLVEKPMVETASLLEKLLKRYKPGEILVLTPFNWDNLREYLDKRFPGLIATDKRFDPSKVNVTTYYSAKGLEAKAVIVVNFNKLFELDKKKSVQERRRLRRLGFVALTRASKELYILGTEDKGAFNELKYLVERGLKKV